MIIVIEDAGTKALKNIAFDFQTFGISPTGTKIEKTDGEKYAEKIKWKAIYQNCCDAIFKYEQ